MQQKLSRFFGVWREKVFSSFNIAHVSLFYVAFYAVLVTTSPHGLLAQDNSFGSALDGTFQFTDAEARQNSRAHAGTTASAEDNGSEADAVEFDAEELRKANCELMMVMKGSLGSLLATVAGIGAVLAGALGMYSAAWTFVIVACSSFIIESIVTIWFPMPSGCDERLFVDILDWATCRLLYVVEDMIGTLVSTVAGIGAIVACVAGAYRAAWAFLFTALGGFILRSLVGFFFEKNLARCIGFTVEVIKSKSQ